MATGEGSLNPSLGLIYAGIEGGQESDGYVGVRAQVAYGGREGA